MYLVNAPASGYLKTIMAKDGSSVRAGDPIGRFHEDYDDIAILQLNILQKIAEITRYKMSDARLAALRENYRVREESARTLRLFRQTSLRETRSKVEVGEAYRVDVDFADVALASARYEYRTLMLEIKTFEAEVESGLRRMDEFEQILKAQVDFVSKRRDSLQLVSQADGDITWYMFEEGYVEQGAPVAKIG